MNAFLPEPRVPLYAGATTIPEPGLLTDLVPEADHYLKRVTQLRAETDQAVLALDTHRPGGKAWEDALRQDTAAVLAGNPPNAWAVETLLTGDPHRWATASALARTLTKRVEATRQDAARDTDIAVKVKTTTERLRLLYATEAPLAWAAARDGDKAGAWAHVGACRDAATAMRQLDRWTAWVANDSDPQRRIHGIAQVDAASLGSLLAAECYLGEPKPVIPRSDVVWPPGFDYTRADVPLKSRSELVEKLYAAQSRT